MKKIFRTNPPWADKILGKHWDAIQRKIGEKNMPLAATEVHGAAELRDKMNEWQAVIDAGNNSEYVRDRHAEVKGKLDKLLKRKNKGYQEFGCGHYGCVMPTSTPGIVFKITTDATEAAFIAAYLSWPKHQRPNGIVRYHKLLSIKSESRLKRPVFIILRDEAAHVGMHALENWIATGARANERDYYSRSFDTVTNALSNALDAAREIRRLLAKKTDIQAILKEAQESLRKLDDLPETGPRAFSTRPLPIKVAYQLQRFSDSAGVMEGEPMGVEVGRALRECLDDHGLLLADVHANNIGMPGTPALLEEIGHTPIITDPGHAITLDDRYKGITVEEV
jgi:hypothetical protein